MMYSDSLLRMSFLYICRKRKSRFHQIGATHHVPAGTQLYETPTSILPGANSIEIPTTHTIPGNDRYITQPIEGNSVPRIQPADYGQEYFSIDEPRVYETALNPNNNTPVGNRGQMYEEPRDSLLQYEQSQESQKSVQQPYEVPVRTSLHDDQGVSRLQHQSSSPASSTSNHNKSSPTYTTLYPGTLEERQTYTLLRHTPDQGVYSTPSEDKLPVATPKEATPPDSHQYFVLSEVQKSSSTEPLYSELENGGQKTGPTSSSAVEEEVDGKRSQADDNDRVYFELEHRQSSASPGRPKEGSSPAEGEHPYFLLEKK